MRCLSFTLCLVLLMGCLVIMPDSASADTMTATSLTSQLTSICSEYNFSTGKYWSYNTTSGSSTSYKASTHKAYTSSSTQNGKPGESGWAGYRFSGGAECWAFAGFLGYKLFGQTNPYSSWTKWSSTSVVKANGLHVGDIIRSSGHSAIIYSISSSGVIKTVECWGGSNNKIQYNGYFNGNTNNSGKSCDNSTFDKIVSNCGFQYVLHAPNNTSPAVWPASAATLPEEPTISGATYPTSLSNGSSFGLRGTITCKYTMTEIRATVTNRVTKANIFNVAVTPNSNAYSIGNPSSETINSKLVFGDSRCNNSYLNYKLTVKYTKDGATLSKVVLDKNFKVGTPTGSIPVDTVSVTPSTLSMQIGTSANLTAAVSPSDAANTAVTWSSSNTSIATVDSNGKVTAKATGSATITATAKDGSGAKGTCAVTIYCDHDYCWVTTVPATQTTTGTEVYKCTICGHIAQTREIPKLSIPVWGWTIVLHGSGWENVEGGYRIPNVGTISLTVENVRPEDATDKSFSFTSLTPDIFTVSDTGVITPLKVGTGTLKITPNGGEGAYDLRNIEVYALSGSCGENAYWTVAQDGTLTITGSGRMTDFSNATKSPWYDISDKITSIYISADITKIGNFAFMGCSSLQHVDMPCVTAIGNGAFVNCESITYFNIPDTCQSIGESAFAGCHHLMYLVLPVGLTDLGMSAFEDCYMMTSYEIPEGVTTLRHWTFSNNYALSSVRIPASVTDIWEHTFDNCGNVIIECYQGSAAHIFALEHGISYRLLDIFVEEIVTPSRRTMGTNETITLSAEVLPENATNKTVIYTLDDTDVITVEEDGTVRSGSTPGVRNVTITAQDSGAVSTDTRVWVYDQNKLEARNLTVSADGVVEYDIYFEGACAMNRIGFDLNDFAENGWECLAFDVMIPHYGVVEDEYHNTMTIVAEGSEPVIVTDAVLAHVRMRPSQMDGYWGQTGVVAPRRYYISANDQNDVTRVMTWTLSGATVDFPAKTTVMTYADVVLPATISRVEDEAFMGISAGRIRLPEQVTAIGSRAFANCSNLTQIYIPAGCTAIAADAFSGDSGLTIYGHSGTYAEFYAGKYDFGFVAVD